MMNIHHLRSWFLKSFVGFLSLTALIAIVSVLAGEFGETQAKILATSFTVSAASICSMACAAFIEKRGGRRLGTAGIGAAALAAALLIAGVWAEVDSEYYWKTVVTAIVVALAIAHTFLLHLPKLADRFDWAQPASAALIGLLGAMVIAAAWGEIDEEGYYRLLTVVSILVVLFTLLVPVFWRIGRGETDTRRRLLLTEDADGCFRDAEGRAYRVEPFALPDEAP